jgi:WD40 repeat protein
LGTRWSWADEHESNIRWLAFRGNNNELLSGDVQGVVRCWNLGAPGSPVFPNTLSAAGETVLTSAISRGLDRVATWGSDQSLRVWNVERDRYSPTELRKLVAPGAGSRVTRLVWGTSGEHLALALIDEGLPKIQLWRVPKGSEVPFCIANREYVTQTDGSFEPWIALSPDETRLAVVNGDSFEVLAVNDDLTALCSQRSPDYVGVRVTFTPDGRRLLIVPGDGEVVLFDIKTGSAVALPRALKLSSLPVFSSLGSTMFAVTQGAKRVLVRWKFDHVGGVREVASAEVIPESEILSLSHDGRLLAIAANVGTSPEVRIVDAERLTSSTIGPLRHDQKTDERVLFAAFLDESLSLLTGTLYGRWWLWNLTAGDKGIVLEPGPETKTHFLDAAYSRETQLLLIHWNSSKSIEVRDLSSRASERMARRVAGRNLTNEEWHGSPLDDVPFHKTFPDLPHAPVARHAGD